MKKNFIFILTFLLIAVVGCNNDDDTATVNSVNVAFASPSVNLTENTTTLNLVFSGATATAGTITLSVATENVVYGTDFKTVPAVANNTLVVPFTAGASSATFSFEKLINAIEGEVKNVKFTITAVSTSAVVVTEAAKSLQVNFNETASLGQSLSAAVGGANQPNQVYVDLSSGTMTVVPRVSWDLGFYAGTDFRIAINGSLKMSAKQLTTTNIDEVQVADESMIISQGAGSSTQIDNPVGLMTGTAIAPVSENDADNKVYLVNLGSNPATNTPASGTEGSASGSLRGWKKIRVLKSGNDYKLQYAEIGATTHTEVVISKNSGYNFSFFSFTTNGTVNVEPQKDKWDLNFTTFTNLVGPTTPYYYPDFIVNNLKGGAKAYMVAVSQTVTYDNFTLANVVDANFTEDQRGIGSNWRSTSVTGSDGIPVSQFVLRTDRFFVVKDPAGNIYKVKLTGGASNTGERGFPTFLYSLL